MVVQRAQAPISQEVIKEPQHPRTLKAVAKIIRHYKEQHISPDMVQQAINALADAGARRRAGTPDFHHVGHEHEPIHKDTAKVAAHLLSKQGYDISAASLRGRVSAQTA